MRVIVAALASFLCVSDVSAQAAWLRGNLHTHTTESDGDAAPAEVVRWYREHGYDFVAITDHDKVTKLEAEGIVLLAGEEVTDKLPKKPLHVNAIGLTRVVPPQGGATIVEVLQRNIDAVREAGGLPAINHPNFGWAFGAAELKQLRNAAFLEIASGHPLVNMNGGGGVPSVEAMWDELLTAGTRIWAIATDDAHHYGCPPPASAAPPGQAWVVVRADKKDAATILAALVRGEFYASTGVALDDYVVTAKTMTVTVRQPPGSSAAKFRTLFLGAHGRILGESNGNPATYTFRGDERYVRAKVVDSNGKVAWLQPTFVPPRAASR